MLNIILCGAPGSGKGTQSQFIVEKYGLEHLSTGDLLRHEIASKSPLGLKVDAIISKGELVPDSIMIELIANYMDTLPATAKGIIFDGFPRTVNQAQELEKLLAERQQTATMIDLYVEETELIERLLNRGKTSGRADDNLETIKKRLDVFHQQTQPVCAYYRQLGKYNEVQGMGTMQEIFAKIDAILSRI
ncbi:MAG: adenylate kinase [Paludibacter sp.]|nr:adenylate kinase [Bacteroidales bacterium]MCM1068641.1 adenylate kinase [Prevotella sp.]MCM1353305.1 adenylate kinase [Bacteroides sp.]MCM1442287.1 adenylate kinase [Muribaculum sp.]MCM1481106.1 adenylate kinase [Paludibacter sp.]